MKKRSYVPQLFESRFPTILQTESTECGLACVAMLANYHGHDVALRDLRLKFSVSLKGISLGSLLRVCKHNGLASRPVRTSLSGLQQIKLPCILHWNFNHFVVLRKISADHAIVVDPAHGELRLPLEQLSQSFTGVAVEVWPNPEFEPNMPQKNVPLTQLMGQLKRRRRALGTVLFLAFVVEMLTVVSPYYIQLVIDNAIGANDSQVFAVLAAGFAVVYLFRNLVLALRSWFLMYLGTSLNVQWKDNILEHMLSLPLEYFEKRHVGDVMSRFGGVDIIQRMLTTAFIESVLDGLFSIVVVVVMFLYQPLLAALVLTSTLLYLMVRWLMNAALLNASRNEIVHSAKQNSYLLETLRGIRQIKLYGQQRERRLAWMTLFIKQVNAKVSTQKLEVGFKLARGVIFDVQNIIVIWCGALLVIDQAYSVGALVAFLSYKVLFETRVATLIDNLFVIQNIQLQADRLGDIVLSTPEVTHEGIAINSRDLPGSLECKDVYFQYSLFEKNVINGLSLTVQDGESVAIIGPSGCGKSTIFNVILGVYQGARGQITLGGMDINTLGVEQVRDMLGTVLQSDILFAGSILENIAGFNDEVDYEWVVKCCEMANIAEEIEAMPMKYYTLVGDMGAVLSGGRNNAFCWPAHFTSARACYCSTRLLAIWMWPMRGR
nr:peptidase domain-containing ABC transporter [Pseudomonas peli]